MCVRRADGRGEERMEEVAEVRGQGAGVSGQQSETMLEGLAEWTDYQLKIQAFNSIGAGPWSNTLTTHTKESGTHTHTNTFVTYRDTNLHSHEGYFSRCLGKSCHVNKKNIPSF